MKLAQFLGLALILSIVGCNEDTMTDDSHATQGGIVGPTGPTGSQGQQGQPGQPGEPGEDGENGKDGKDGNNGLISWVDKSGKPAGYSYGVDVNAHGKITTVPFWFDANDVMWKNTNDVSTVSPFAHVTAYFKNLNDCQNFLTFDPALQFATFIDVDTETPVLTDKPLVYFVTANLAEVGYQLGFDASFGNRKIFFKVSPSATTETLEELATEEAGIITPHFINFSSTTPTCVAGDSESNGAGDKNVISSANLISITFPTSNVWDKPLAPNFSKK